MKQVNKHQKQSILCIIRNTKIHHLKKSKYKVVFDRFLIIIITKILVMYFSIHKNFEL